MLGNTKKLTPIFFSKKSFELCLPFHLTLEPPLIKFEYTLALEDLKQTCDLNNSMDF